MESFVIDCVGWYKNQNIHQDIAERFYVICKFLQENGLTVRNLCNQKSEIDDNFTIHSEDLTIEGLLFMKKAYSKWVTAIDRGKKPTDIKNLQKALQAIRI